MDDLNLEPGDDLLCIACGYDLRELPHDGDCPECGLAISRSEDSDQLARADPKWLALVARGLGFYISGHIGIVVAILGFFGCVIFTLVFSAATPVTGPQSWMAVLITGLVAMLVVSLFLMGVGTFLLASPDPGRNELRKERCLRLLARFALPGLILLAAILSLLDFLPPTAFRSMLMNISIILLIMCGGFAVVMVMLYVARLIKRIPMDPLQESITKAARFLLWAAPVYGVAFWFQTVLIPSGVGGNLFVAVLYGGLGCATWFLGIFLIGTIVQQGLMMFQCRRAICSCRDIAMQLTDNLAEEDKNSIDGG